MKENYEQDHSHYHCWEQDNPPCGMKNKNHRCCICLKKKDVAFVKNIKAKLPPLPPTNKIEDKIIEKFIKKFCIPRVHGINLDPEHFDEPENRIRNTEIINFLKEELSQLKAEIEEKVLRDLWEISHSKKGTGVTNFDVHDYAKSKGINLTTK